MSSPVTTFTSQHDGSGLHNEQGDIWGLVIPFDLVNILFLDSPHFLNSLVNLWQNILQEAFSFFLEEIDFHGLFVDLLGLSSHLFLELVGYFSVFFYLLVSLG